MSKKAFPELPGYLGSITLQRVCVSHPIPLLHKAPDLCSLRPCLSASSDKKCVPSKGSLSPYEKF